MIIYHSGAEKGGLGELVYELLSQANVMMSFTDLRRGSDRFWELLKQRRKPNASPDP